MRQRTLLQKNNTRKPIIQVPEIHAPHPALIVQLAVHIKRLVCRDLELPHALAGNRPVVQRRIEFIAPWRAIAVAVAVVVAEEVVAVGFGAAADLERLVDGGEEVFGKVGDERGDGLEVVLCVAGVEATEEVAIPVSGLSTAGSFP